MIFKKVYIILLILFITGVADIFAQETKKKKDYTFKGYIKDLQSATFTTDTFANLILTGSPENSLTTRNLIHHRLNFKWYINENWTSAIEWRNQLFWGEEIKLNSNFAEQIGMDAGIVDLSFNIIDKPFAVLNSQFDRAWLGWQGEKWEFRIGRQRINWGQILGFNPNDLFNTYNLLDFDYEERPGTDAVKLTYNPNFNSSIEFAFSPDTLIENSTTAIKYGFNKWQYDFQLIGGYFKQDIALGTGWAGNIKNAGWKGEVMYFIPTDTTGIDNLNIALSYDNILGGGVFFTASTLFNMNGLNEANPLALASLANAQFNPKNIFPFKYTFLVSANYSLNPITSIALSTIYSPGVNVLILSPSVTYSIAENWDLNLFVQSFSLESTDRFKHFSSAGFLRLKYSY